MSSQEYFMQKKMIVLIAMIFCCVLCQALTITGGNLNTVNINNGVNGYVYSTAINYGINYGTWGTTTIATFTPNADERIQILGVGLGGDLGGGASTTVFKIYGGGLNFQFYAGSTSYSSGSNLYLGTTAYGLLTQIGGVAAMTANLGETVYIQNLLNIDPDGQAIQNATDPFGNTFNDYSNDTSARRVWINYTVVAVPEASTFVLLSLSGFMMAFLRRYIR